MTAGRSGAARRNVELASSRNSLLLPISSFLGINSRTVSVQPSVALDTPYTMDAVPVFSQAKSLFQDVTGDTRGARETQKNFFRKAPVISQLTSLGALVGE